MTARHPNKGLTCGYNHSMGDADEWVRKTTGVADLGTDPFPELQSDEQKVDWIRRRMGEQLAENPNAPTILDAIATARENTRQADQQFWDIVNNTR